MKTLKNKWTLFDCAEVVTLAICVRPMQVVRSGVRQADRSDQGKRR